MYKVYEINFFAISEYPVDGWLQICRCCKGALTSALILIQLKEGKRKIIKYCAFLCKDCKNRLNCNPNEKYIFKRKCHKMIYEYETYGELKQDYLNHQVYVINKKN